MKISPSNFDEKYNSSPGEKLLFQKLVDASNAPNWLVLHSLELQFHKVKSQGECDFIFFIPNHGILVLEVKAHQTVKYDGREWWLGDKKESRGPFKQANDAMWSVKDYLKTRQIDMRDIPIVYAVWFTNLSSKNIPKSIEWTPEQVLCEEDLKNDVVTTLTNTIESLVSQLKINFPSDKASVKSLEAAENALRPRFSAHQQPAKRKKQIDEFLSSALEEQIKTVEIIRDVRAAALDGLAGTGKTHIALQAAREASNRGEKTLFVCFNSLLAQKIRQQLQDFSLVKVATVHSLMMEVSGASLPDDATENWWKNILPELAFADASKLSQFEKFDTLIIDEAQDLGISNYLMFLNEVMRGGFAECTKIFICGDFKNQGIYEPGPQTKSYYSSMIPGLNFFPLNNMNCRNTQRIGTFLEPLLVINPSYNGYLRKDNDGELITLNGGTEDKLRNSVNTVISKFLTKFLPEQIVILSPQKTELENFVGKLSGSFSPLKLQQNGKVQFGSTYEFKGLEALAIILIEFETENKNLRDTFYVAGTRALVDFAFYISQAKLQKLIGKNND